MYEDIQSFNLSKSMKKAAIVISVILFIAIALSSCKPSNKCPAYGEHYKYQKDQKY